MPHQTDDAQLPVPLPPNPFASGTPATSPRHDSTTAIDLTSPPGSPHVSRKRQHVPDNKRRGPGSNRRASDDEKRLTGDYDVPADRVFAPDPGSYFQQPRTAMVKPGSGAAFQPLNTFNSAQRAPSAAKHVTYGKKPRAYAASGEATSHGQTAFEHFYDEVLSTPTRNAPPRQNHATQALRVSPTKRRKTVASTPPQVIDLDDEEEVQEVVPHDALVAPILSKRIPPSTPPSAHSRQGAGSRPTSRGLLSSFQSKNEFLGTQSGLQNSRKSARKSHCSNGDNSSKRSTSGSVTPRIQDTTVDLEEDEDMVAAPASRPSNSRRLILKDFKQGVKDPRSGSGKSQETRSKYFENARINESTIDTGRQIPMATQAKGSDETLRSFRRASITNNCETISDDELGQVLTQTARAAHMGPTSPSKAVRTANSSIRRKSKAQEAAQGWPLIRARTHDFDSEKTFMSTTCEHPLILRHGRDLNTLEIATWRDKYQDYTVLATITSKNVIKGQADDVGRIRLEGPRATDGTLPIFDLQFESLAHFREFRNDHLPKYCTGRKVFTKTEVIMEVLFRRPLQTNDKAKKHLLVRDAPPAEVTAEAPLWTGMKIGTQRTLPAASNRGLGESSDLTAHARTSGRSTRTTRAMAPTYDSYDSEHGKGVNKFSEVEGLGTRWVKDLTYHEGRHRSSVLFNDLPRLDEEEFLNDNLIDFYMIYLFKHSKLPSGKVHFFNTFFYTSLTQNTGRDSINYDAVKRWTSRDDIFDFDYIVVPINQDAHWYLAIICNVKNIDRKAIEEDFDDVAPKKVANGVEAFATNADAMTMESLSVPRLVQAPEAPATPEVPYTLHADDEINLFDEESKLNLINPDATEIAKDRPGTTNADAPGLPPSQQRGNRATLSIVDPPAPLKTVLSNLHSSPEKKKKTKRRSMAPRRDPSQPVIIILDSLSQTRSPAVRALKDWIVAEGDAKRGMDAVIKEKGLYPKADQIPTQSNFSDCGVYLLGYVEKFFQDPDEFKRKILTGEMTAAEDWPQLKPKDMRNNLRDIIFAMADEQQLTVPATKKKKGKKSAVADKSSPGKAESVTLEAGATSHRLKQPTVGVGKPEAMSPQTTSTVTDPQPPNAQTGAPAAVPRLGSPFSYKKTEKFASTGKAPTRAVRSASPTKAGVTTPHQDGIHGRRTHPEIRVPRQISSVKEGREKVHSVLIQTGSKARSLSPPKRTRHRTDDVEQIMSPTKSTPGLQLTERRDNAGAEPTGKHNLHGQPDCPIEISDSQEPGVAFPQSPPRKIRPPPTPRKHPSRSPRQTQALHHVPSFEEIPEFSPRVDQLRARQGEEDFIGSQLVAQLDANDAQRATLEEAKTRGSATPSLQRRQSDPDVMEVDSRDNDPPEPVMEVDSRGNDPMDIAEDIHEVIADDTICETPEAARMSPPVLPL